MRARSLCGAALLAVVACGCGGYEDAYWPGDNEIVFGISQRTVATAEGEKKEVVAGYEYLRLAHKGGWGPWVFRDGDGEGTCYFERFDQRLGKPHVESGAASFTGGRLPTPGGLQILANQPDVSKHDGLGWEHGDVLHFDVSGFALPPIPRATMFAPATHLEIESVSPAPAEGARELTIRSTDSVAVTWKPVREKPFGRVMVSLETEDDSGRGAQVRCFGTNHSGSAVIPAHWVARLFSTVDPNAPIKGRLDVAAHRQVTIYARGGWIVYVVATSMAEGFEFTGTR